MSRFEIAIVVLSIALLVGAVARHFKHAHDAAKRIVPDAAQKQWIFDQEAQWGVKQPAPGTAGKGNIAIGLPDTIDIPFGYDATNDSTTAVGFQSMQNAARGTNTVVGYGRNKAKEKNKAKEQK